MIVGVILWTNGTVTAFDRDGRQMPEYQGRLDHVLEKILADTPPEARFHVGAWRGRRGRDDPGVLRVLAGGRPAAGGLRAVARQP
jgi:hypothetical protein